VVVDIPCPGLDATAKVDDIGKSLVFQKQADHPATDAMMADHHGFPPGIEFLQLFGLTGAEYEAVQSGTVACEELLLRHQRTNPMLVTDLDRKSD